MAVYKTVQRKMLLDFLGTHAGQSFTVRQIVAGMNGCGENAPSESTVYRLMRELVDDGTVRKDVDVESRENVYRLECGSDAGVSMRCKICGSVYNVDGESSRRIKEEVSRCGAVPSDDNIELIIKCRKCGKS